MNCLDFRRHKLADPRLPSAEAQAHMEGCPACAAFGREVDESERALDRALQTPVPEGLADRVMQTASIGGWSALARPVRGGYYAIVTASPAATSSFEKMLRDCIILDT